MWKNIKSFIFPHIDNDQNRTKQNTKKCYSPLSHSSKIDKEYKKHDKAIWT